MDVEIEEPTEEQRRDAVMGQAVRVASKAAWDTEVIAYLVSQNMPKVEAKTLLPEVRERARPLMNRHFAKKRLIGWLLIASAVGIAASAFFHKDAVTNLPSETHIPTLVIAIIPLIGGIRHIVGARTPLDSELGLPSASSDAEEVA